MSTFSRRTFLTASAASAVLAACSSSKPKATSSGSSSAASSSSSGLPDPARAPFDTVVVLMMENRSFDHLLGWVPGANGKQAGLTYPDRQGNPVPTVDLGADVQGCTFSDPKHQWPEVAQQFNGGKCDGWLATQASGDHYPIGYYAAAQVPILGALAQSYTLFDNYFCSMQGGTWPNRFYQLCAATDIDTT